MADKEVKVTKVTTDMVKPFSGDGDVVAWIEKVKLVAKLAGVVDIATLLPLYLEGSALSVYLEMSEKEREDAKSIIARLKEVYSDSAFVAYSKLTKVKWAGESVDVLSTELRRLAGLAGFTGAEVEKVVRLAFINSFPDSISIDLQQIDGINTMSVSKILMRARVLTANYGGASSSLSAGAVAVQQVRREEVQGRGRGRGKSYESAGSNFKGKCYTCGGPHMARSCPDKVVKCYNCGKEGHLSYNCEAGNA